MVGLTWAPYVSLTSLLPYPLSLSSLFFPLPFLQLPFRLPWRRGASATSPHASLHLQARVLVVNPHRRGPRRAVTHQGGKQRRHRSSSSPVTYQPLDPWLQSSAAPSSPPSPASSPPPPSSYPVRPSWLGARRQVRATCRGELARRSGVRRRSGGRRGVEWQRPWRAP